MAARVYWVGGFSEAKCFREKRARNRTARGVASETRATRRGAIGSGSLRSDGELPEPWTGVLGDPALRPEQVVYSGVTAVGAMMDRLWCGGIEKSSLPLVRALRGRRAWRALGSPGLKTTPSLTLERLRYTKASNPRTLNTNKSTILLPIHQC